ncbi:hypothetical protein [Tortoise microvirus 58]|nr:hypothetical protein [Tortoise microvirus 58]
MDVAYERIHGLTCAPNVALAIRDISPTLKRVAPHFLDDMELREIGYFDSDLEFHPTPAVVHSWDEYKDPEQPVTPLSDGQLKDFQR